VFRRKTLEKKITAIIRAEFTGIIAGLERDHREYLHWLKRKKETQGALERAKAKVRGLHSERIELKKQFWKAYYEKDKDALSEIEFQSSLLERATKKAEKALNKARADFERADFDEVAESFALRTKSNIAEDEVNRRVETLEKTLEELLAGVRRDIKQVGQALRDEYKEPHFDTAEERDAHVKKTTEILNALTEGYTPGK
jgi:hypothetical protein